MFVASCSPQSQVLLAVPLYPYRISCSSLPSEHDADRAPVYPRSFKATDQEDIDPLHRSGTLLSCSLE